MNPEEINARIQRIEKDLAELKAELRRTETSASNQARPVAPAQTAPVSRPPGVISKWLGRVQEDSMEVFLGGNLLGKLGLVAIVLAAAWFVQLAFQNGWVNESGRIYTGLVVGFAVCGTAIWLARRKLRVVPAPLLGAGISIVYISVFSAYHFYYLLGITETFLALALLSALATLTAIIGNRQSLYVFALLGAYLAPIMLSRGENSYRFLFTYIGVIQTGFLVVSWYRPWRFSAYAVLFATSGIWSGWAAANLEKSGFAAPMAILLFTLGAFYVRHAFLSGKHESTPRAPDLVLLALSAIFTASAGYYLVDHHYPRATGHFLLLLAAGLCLFYLRQGNIFRSVPDLGTRSVVFFEILVFVFAAITRFFDGRTLTLSWILLASALSISAVYLKTRPVLLVSMIVWVMAVMRLLFADPTPVPYRLILNERFALFVIAGIGASITHLVHRRDPFESLARGFAFLSMFLFVFGSLLENHDSVTSVHYRNLGYSYVLALYAALFLVYGFVRNHRTMRLSGVVLAALVVGKLYLYDIWRMSDLVRIIAGFSLGLALVVLSIVYQKYRDKFLEVGKSLMIWFVLPAALFLSLQSLHAESFRAGNFKKVASLTPQNGSVLGDAKTSYGQFLLTDELVAAGTQSLRIAYKNRALPYLVRAARDDERGGQGRPEVVYEEGLRDGRIYVLKMPPLPEGRVWTNLEADSSQLYESGLQIEAGEKPGNLNVIGHRTVFHYADQSEKLIRIDAGRAAYLRITLDKNIPLNFPAAHYSIARQRESSFEIPVQSWKQSTDSDRSATVLEFPNSERRKIQRFKLQFSEPRFRRTVEVYTYSRVAHEFQLNTTAGLMKRKDDAPEQVIDLAGPALDAVKIVILNEDDAPLHLTSSFASAPLDQIVFKLPDPEEVTSADDTVQIFAGNDYVGPPAYDIDDTLDKQIRPAEFTAGTPADNAAFSYSIVEPPLSVWIIRALFYLGLIGLVFPCVKIFRSYASEVK